jgi:hypothetical protein
MEPISGGSIARTHLSRRWWPVLNGYAKIDPTSGAKRYWEYRRITAVTWTFANGSTFEQSLQDGVTTPQRSSFLRSQATP